MSLLLHLSDLHLGTINENDVVGDYKNDIVSLAERTNRYELLRNSLQQLSGSLAASKKSLDGVIISGDITFANGENGFQRLEEVLDWLGAVRPDPNKIVVVPGNHDVQWETPHGSTERYRLFLQYVRDRGYITPLLEGVNLADHGVFTEPIDEHCLVSPDHQWAVVPINSSNYCGSLQPLAGISEGNWGTLPGYLAGRSATAQNEIERELKRLRVKDVARVSTDQLLAVQRLVHDIKERCASVGETPILIGVVHHHILPVSVTEEFKEFESITNLGQFRCALRDNDLSIVLHGHKHVEFAYVDQIPPMLPHQETSPHSVIVLSGQSPTDVNFSHGSVGRLIELQGKTLVCSISITDIPWVLPGTSLHLASATVLPLSNVTSTPAISASEITLVEGASVNEVYEKALSRFSGPEHLLPNFVCRIAMNGDEVELPKAYPSIPDVEDAKRAAWFEDLVGWWQKNDFQRLSPGTVFNHGHRIFSYNTTIPYKAVNQLEMAIQALNGSARTSRAVVTLLKPTVDNVKSNSQFPSFCLLQFVVRQVHTSIFLEAISYFRKQEMRYWWPVNVAEISRLQKKVFEEVKIAAKTHLRHDLQLGPITTIAAIAEIGGVVPTILVPAVDFDLEVQPQRLWDITYAACWAEMPDREKQIETWKLVLTSLIPAPDQDSGGVLVPVSGIQYLAGITNHFSAYHPVNSRDLAEEWQSLAQLNLNHATSMAEDRLSSTQHREWRENVLRHLNRIRVIVQRCFSCEIHILS